MSRIRGTPVLLAAALVVAGIAPVAAQEDAPTPEGTDWYLVSYDIDGERVDVPWYVDASLSLEAGRAAGSAGCNGFLSNYQLRNRTVSFREPGTTDTGCGDAWMEVERAYMAGLPTIGRWLIDTGPTGQRGLILEGEDVVLRFEEPIAGLTPSDIGQLFSVLEAQQSEMDALRRRIRDLEREGE